MPPPLLIRTAHRGGHLFDDVGSKVKIYKKKQHLLDTINEIDWESDKCCLVDWNDIGDLENMIGALKSRLGELRAPKQKEQIANQLLCIQKIYDTDTSRLYVDDEVDRKYYVYAHCDPSKKIIAGKGARTTFAAALGMRHPFILARVRVTGHIILKEMGITGR